MSRIASALSHVGLNTNERNHEGFPTFRHGLRDEVRNYLRCGTLSGTFYVGVSELTAEILDKLALLGRQDPRVLAEEIIGARLEGYMRTLPILALVVLSGTKDKELFYETGLRVLRTPKDVAQFVEICKTRRVLGLGFGGCRTRLVKRWLQSLSEWHALKGTQHREVSLGDAVRLARPRPGSDVMRERLGWASGHVPGKKVVLNARLAAFEQLKRTTSVEELVGLIREAGLPYEAVTAAVVSPSREVWEALLRNAPTFNLLRSLATFQRHGVFESDVNVQFAVEKLTAEDALRSARILPFRAYTAWKAYRELQGADFRIVAALSDMLDMSVVNLPQFPGTVCIAPDVSGSMTWNFIDKGKTRAIDIAGIFAAGLLRQTPKAIVLPFETGVRPISLNPRDSVLTNTQKIARLGGGGTSVSAPVEQLLRERRAVDLLVAITDNEEWVGRGFVHAWRQYKAEVAPAAKAVLVTVVPDPHRVVPASEPDVRYVHGWSDAVLRYVADVGGAVFDSADPDEAA